MTRKIIHAIFVLASFAVASIGYSADAPAPTTQKSSATPAVKAVASFEDSQPFIHGPVTLEFPDMEKAPPDPKMQVVAEHATDGQKALKVHNGTLSLQGPLDWAGYDYLKLDVFSDSPTPKVFMVLLEDDNTQGHHWWQGQLFGAVLPGKNTLVLPIAGIRGGGKGRPAKPLEMGKLKLVSFKIFAGDLWSCNYDDTDALYLDNIRLEKETDAQPLLFDGLKAFDLGTDISPVMPGFTRLGPSDLYSKATGFGLLPLTQLVGPVEMKRSLDFFRPDPLYRDSLAIEKGGVAIDLPNGTYRVFMNIDLSAGFWGETQSYLQRKVTANGKLVVDEKMTFAQRKDRHFSHYDVEDWPGLDVWEKYVKPCYHEKVFDVKVDDGQLKLEFDGPELACAVSAIVVYPVEKADQGQKFLDYLQAKQKWFFNLENKEVTHVPTGNDFAPSGQDQQRGATLFTRSIDSEVYYNDKPAASEALVKLGFSGFKGQSMPADLCVLPLKDMGKATVTVSDLSDGRSKIPGSAVDVGYVSYRITRAVYEGTMYEMRPRYVRPENSIALPQGVSRRFWLRLNVPASAAPGLYTGTVKIATEKAGTIEVPVEASVLHGSLDAMDIPVGPFGYSISIPWVGGDAEAQAFNAKLAQTSLKMIRDCGFTSFTGMPSLAYRGFKDGKPDIDFATADAQMKMARDMGFSMPILSYVGFGGLNLYNRDLDAMKAAGFSDYSEFIKAVFTAVQQHADQNNWLPVYYVLGDEPAGKEDVLAATENAQAYRKAFPDGPPWFTLFGSCVTGDTNDMHFNLYKTFHAIAWGGHSEASVNALHGIGGQWGMYNGCSRWTFGDYLYKAAKQYGCKFHLAWHWNVASGDPYFGLDTREEDFCWVNASPDGRLIPSLLFERVREGVVDYRMLLTLDRLSREKGDMPQAKQAQELIQKRLNAIKLGEREALGDTDAFRKQVAEAIDQLSSK